MKKLIKSILITALFIGLSICISAQTPPHPNGGVGPGSGNTPVGGGAPVDGGIGIMLLLGTAYGFRKATRLFKAIRIEKLNQ